MDARLQDYLYRSAERDPDRVALVMGDERRTYGETLARTAGLAAALADRGAGPGTRVVVLAEKSPATVTALLAVLATGAAYVPIDPASPAARVTRIVSAAEPVVLLTDAASAPLVDALVDGSSPVAGASFPVVGGVEEAVTGLRFTTAFDAATAGPADLPPRTRGGDELAHLLFTSGSTGVPKGVMVTHDSVRAFIDWTVRHFGIGAGERLSGHAPLHFDMSTLDIYSALAAGAELHLVPPSIGPDPHALARMIREHELTQWFSVPTALAYLGRFDAVAQDDFPALRRLMWCGEPLPTPVLAHWMRRLPHVAFTNLYGPTEATVASSFHPVPDVPADETVPTPIGRACDGERLRVLDEHRRPVADDEIGDLYISGVGLSPGYWRDAEKTAAAFVPDPDDPDRTLYRTGDLARRDADGVLHFLGRADSQIKSRGYRIELGEIEAALVTVTGVRACAVLGVDLGGLEGTTICAVVTADGDIPPSAPALRAELGTLLPHYMLPARWLVLDELPANVNGKVDRPALRALFAPPASAAA